MRAHSAGLHPVAETACGSQRQQRPPPPVVGVSLAAVVTEGFNPGITTQPLRHTDSGQDALSPSHRHLILCGPSPPSCTRQHAKRRFLLGKCLGTEQGHIPSVLMPLSDAVLTQPARGIKQRVPRGEGDSEVAGTEHKVHQCLPNLSDTELPHQCYSFFRQKNKHGYMARRHHSYACCEQARH